MTEREMRDIVGAFIANNLKKVVLPTTMGVGLALSMAGCGEMDDGTETSQEALQNNEEKSDQLPVTKYMGPFPTTKKCVVGNTGIQVNVNDACTVSFYTGFSSRGSSGGSADTPVALYSAPMPTQDAGVAAPLYAAPMPDAGLPSTLYAAPMPQECSGTWQVIKTVPLPVPAYMAPIDGDDGISEDGTATTSASTYPSVNVCACLCDDLITPPVDPVKDECRTNADCLPFPTADDTTDPDDDGRRVTVACVDGQCVYSTPDQPEPIAKYAASFPEVK